jgi:hypothetical protein
MVECMYRELETLDQVLHFRELSRSGVWIDVLCGDSSGDFVRQLCCGLFETHSGVYALTWVGYYVLYWHFDLLHPDSQARLRDKYLGFWEGGMPVREGKC